MARVVIQNLGKRFRGPKDQEVWAVRDASLIVEDKEFVVLVGPSGSGKSTLLRLIAGLEDITRGAISLDGQVVNNLPPKDRDIAMVFQNYALYPHMTVYENMAFGLKLRRVPRAEIDQRIKAAAGILGLMSCLDRWPKALSGGQRQRVAVGRAIVRQPKLFLFDEPLSNLDAPLRAQMRTELRKLHDRLGATMLYVTHDQVEATTMGDRIAVMNAGVLQQIAVPLDLYQRPANLFVAGFIGSPPMNFFRGHIVRQANGLAFAEQYDLPGTNTCGFALRISTEHTAQLHGLEGQPVVLGLRPENISPPASSGQAENTVRALVEVIEPMGAETYLHLSTGAHSFVARVGGGFKADRGQPLLLRLDMGQAHFFDPGTGQAIFVEKNCL